MAKYHMIFRIASDNPDHALVGLIKWIIFVGALILMLWPPQKYPQNGETMMTPTPEAPAAMDERDARCREAAQSFLAGAIDADALLDRIREACDAYTAALKRDLGQG